MKEELYTVMGKPRPGEEEYTIIGKPMPTADARLKVTGAAMFGPDLFVENMLYGKILRSHHAHARILNIDTSRAERLSGVKAVVTAEDTPKKKIVNDMTYPRFAEVLGIPEIPTPEALADQYYLAVDKVRHIGEPIAAVAAIDEDTAEEALELIEVDYELLPAVFDLEEAMNQGAPLLHEAYPGNIASADVDSFGDVEKGLKESDYVREDDFTFRLQDYRLCEPHNTVASFDPMSGKVTLEGCISFPFFIRSSLAQMLDMPVDKVRVITDYTGGHYGCRFFLYPPQFCAAVLAIKTERPVRVLNTREEDPHTVLGKHPVKISIKTGVKKDGTLMAKDIKFIGDIGAYRLVASIPPGKLVGWTVSTVSKLPNMRMEGKYVYTNKPVFGPLRGYLSQQMYWSNEQQHHFICKDLGIDPVDFQLKNAYTMDFEDPRGWGTSSCALDKCIEESSKKVGWKEKSGELRPFHGMGLASGHMWTGITFTPDPMPARVKLDDDGTVTFTIMGHEGGQGQYQTIRMMIAETLGLPLEKVKRTSQDTEFFTGKHYVHTSNLTYSIGSVVVKAAEKIKADIFEVVSDEWEASPDDLVCRDARVFVKGSPSKEMSFKDAARLTIRKKGSIEKKEEFKTRMTKKGKEAFMRAFFEKGLGAIIDCWSYQNSCAEVEVDPETGKVTVDNLVFGQDSGFILNPLMASVQILEGTVYSMGHGIYEELTMKDGQIMETDYVNYKMPLAVDIPKNTHVIFVDSRDPVGPFGLKEIAEGAMSSQAPAIVNAIFDATGVQVKDWPITPDRILKALEEGDKGKKK